MLHVGYMVFPGGSGSREFACNMGDCCAIPGLGRSPGEGNGCPLQYSCLANSIDRGAWWATVHKAADSDTTEQLTHTWDIIQTHLKYEFLVIVWFVTQTVEVAPKLFLSFESGNHEDKKVCRISVVC